MIRAVRALRNGKTRCIHIDNIPVKLMKAWGMPIVEDI
jgi:hypothetical protein